MQRNKIQHKRYSVNWRFSLGPIQLMATTAYWAEKNNIDNDATVDVLSRMSILAAEAGYDLVAPSDMMDGRKMPSGSRLDDHNFTDTGIISYSAKFSSAYYGPLSKSNWIISM